MTLILREQDIRQVLTMDAALEALEDGFRQQGQGQTVIIPRARIRLLPGTLQLMSAALPGSGVMGFKSYSVSRSGIRFLVNLYDIESGELLALLEADYLGRTRTGAASGIATKYLARKDADTVAIFGSGGQAEAQLRAICAVRSINSVEAYSRNQERLEAFCNRMADALDCAVEPAASPADALDGAGIVVTITTAREPVFDGKQIEKGVHINAAGSNSLVRRELDDEAVRRATVIVTDSREQARIECGDLLPSIERGRLQWEQVQELGDIVVGHVPGRANDDDVTLFESQGIALEDVAVAAKAYRLAREKGIGQEIELFKG